VSRSMMITRSTWRAVALSTAASLCLVLAACGGGSAGSSSSGGSVIKVAQDISYPPGPIFDSVDFQSGPYAWMSLIYGSMALQTPEGLKPELATSWEYPNGRTIVIHLRKGVKFQDGSDFNAAAVKKSWDRIIQSKTMLKTAGVAAMSSVETSGDSDVTVSFSRDVTGDWRDRFLTSADSLGVASPAALDKYGADYHSQPVGAGPYRLEKYTVGQSIVLKRWDGFFDKSQQPVDEYQFIQTSSGAPTVASLLSGQTDISRVGFDDAASLKKQGIDITVAYPTDSAGTFLAYCTTKGPLQDLDARKALSLAVNAQEFIDRVYNGMNQPNSFPLNKTSPYHKDMASPYSFDVDKAKQLANSSGLTGKTLKILVSPAQTKAAETLQSQFKAIGVALDIETNADVFKTAPTSMPDMTLWGYATFPVAAYSSYVLPEGPGNWCKNSSPNVTEAWYKTRDTSLTDPQLSDAWAAFQDALNTSLPLYVFAGSSDPIATTKRVTGVQESGNLGTGSIAAWTSLQVK